MNCVYLKILAIETSCDETAIALLECEGSLESPKFKVLGNSLISQIELHKEYGGVYPMLAKREHQKNLPILLEKVLAEVRSKNQEISLPEDIDYICITSGPGLEPALWVGILFAEELGEKWGVPVIPINHMEGHIYSILEMQEVGSREKEVGIKFPALALLVSGGHTELVLMKDHGSYEIVGKTRDDAIGEAFDKVARLLDLPYPGGPKISALAELHRQRGLIPSFEFPRPMIHSKDLDFSFSGLKTSVLYKLKKEKANFPINKQISEDTREEFARAFEEAAIDTLIEKTRRAINKFVPKTLIVAGGVSQNSYLQRELLKLPKEFTDLILRIPESTLTGDNALMIGIAGYMNILNNLQPTTHNKPEKIIARGNLSLEETL